MGTAYVGETHHQNSRKSGTGNPPFQVPETFDKTVWLFNNYEIIDFGGLSSEHVNPASIKVSFLGIYSSNFTGGRENFRRLVTPNGGEK